MNKKSVFARMMISQIWTGLLFCILLSGCENFLTGGDIKNQIDEAIAYANAKECTLIVKSESSCGTFLSEGEKKCRLGYSTELQFTVTTEDYYFMGLEAVCSTNNAESRAECVEFTVENPDEARESGVYKISVRLLKAADDILIRPKFVRLENGNITITESKGDFNPLCGTYNLIIGRTFSISFTPNSDYEFIRWQVYDKSTEEEFPDGQFITFDDVESKNTFFTFSGLPEGEGIELALRPIICERPQILSYSPTYETNGSWSDTTIQIVFDYAMDTSSIYYTKDEIQKLNQGGISYADFLPPVQESELSDDGTLLTHYGYTKDFESFFKNIIIEDKRTEENLAKYYDAPLFDDPTTLFIPVKVGAASNLKKGMNIKVTVDSGFCYKVEKKSVCMGRSEKWLYLANGRTDDAVPGLSIEGFSIDETNVAGSGSSSDGEGFVQIQSDGSNIYSLFNGRFIKKNSLTLNINNLDVSDSGSNPNSKFAVVYKKVYDKDYKALTNPMPVRESVNYDSVVGPFANFTGSVELKDLEDGVYEIYLDVRDRSNNSKCYPARDSGSVAKAFYVSVDNTKPVINTQSLAITSVSGSQTNFRLNFTSNDKDLYQTVVKIREYTGNQSEESWEEISGATFSRGVMPTLSASVRGKRYEVHAEFIDAAGNSTSKVLSRYSMPNKASNLRTQDMEALATVTEATDTYHSDTATYKSKVKLLWSRPAGELDSYKIEVYKRDFNENCYAGLGTTPNIDTFYKSTYTLIKTVVVSKDAQSCVFDDLEYVYDKYRLPLYKFKIISCLEDFEFVDSYCYTECTAMAAPPYATVTLGYNNASGMYPEKLGYSAKCPPVYESGGTSLWHFWDDAKESYKFYLYLGEKEEDVKKPGNAMNCEITWDNPSNINSSYKLNNGSIDPPEGFVVKRPYPPDWYYFGYADQTLYYAVKTVYNNGSGYETVSWSPVVNFFPEKEYPYTIVKQRNRTDTFDYYIKMESAKYARIRWRKKRDSDWTEDQVNTEGSHGNPYATPQYCITTPMEYGATYELIIEGCENVGGSRISASRITSRTHMEIKIETTQ